MTAGDLWEAIAHGRPSGHPDYRRPGRLAGSATRLPWTGLDPLDRTRHDAPLDDLTALACFLTGICGITRFEPHDLLGPHHVTPTIRGVRVVEVEVEDSRGSVSRYDPVEHTLVERAGRDDNGVRDHRTASPAVGRAVTRVRVLVSTDRVPAGYEPIRHAVGLLEAGMHATTATHLATLLLPDWHVEAGAVPEGLEAGTAWTLLTLRRDAPTDDTPGPGSPGRSGRPASAAAPAASTAPGIGAPAGSWARVVQRLLARAGHTRPPDRFDEMPPSTVWRRRSSGRGPWGVAPEAPSESDRVRTRELVAAETAYRAGGAVLDLHLVDPARYAEVFTYPADVVDVASAHTALVWTTRRATTATTAAARTALLCAGAEFMDLALRLTAEGLVVRPARSIDPDALHALLGLAAEETIVLTGLVARDSYQELTIHLA